MATATFVSEEDTNKQNNNSGFGFGGAQATQQPQQTVQQPQMVQVNQPINQNGFQQQTQYNPISDQPNVFASFGTAIGNGFKKYVTFHGRASVNEFFWWALFVFLVNALFLGVAAIIAFFSFSSLFSNPQDLISLFAPEYASSFGLGVSSLAGSVTAIKVFVIIDIVADLALIVPSIAVCIRRLHDINRTGVLAVIPWIFLLIPSAALVGWLLIGYLMIQKADPAGSRWDR
ncbi:MAG: DUF805 domain-containing protein [Candidatus Ancillula sp.]|jgi:uncharacterized membrane protein YhaH (DUF805 family)|nr:DUF805 domain-containing protein [Candidatus Ancillula sp.]